MLFGKVAILRSGKHGMLGVHMDALVNVARETNYVYIVRNVSPYATDFIAAGCPTKPFGVNIKSCKVGIFAGAFPMDPYYSHGAEKNYAVEAEALKQVLLDNKDFQEVPLVLDEKRIAWLCERGQLQKAPYEGGFRLTWKNPAGQPREAFAIKNTAGTYDIQDKTGKKLMALGQKVTLTDDKQTVKPLTADYDLFAVLVETAKLELGTLDHAPLSTQQSGDKEFKALKKKGYRGPIEDPKMGNVTERMKMAIQQANGAVAKLDASRGVDGLKVFHHNAEINNPKASELKNSLPLLLFLPLEEKYAQQAVVLIQTEEEASAVRELLVEAGFYWPYNALFNMHFSSFSVSQMSILTEPRGTIYRRVPALPFEQEFSRICGLMHFNQARKTPFGGINNNAWWAEAFRQEQENRAQRGDPKKVFSNSPSVSRLTASSTPPSASSSQSDEEEVVSPTSATTPFTPSSSQVVPVSIRGFFMPPPSAPIDEKDELVEMLGRRYDRSSTSILPQPVLTFTGTISSDGRDKKIINLQQAILTTLQSIAQDPSDQDLVDSLSPQYSELVAKIESYKINQKLSRDDSKKLEDFLNQTRDWAEKRGLSLRVVEVSKSTGRKISSWAAKQTHVVKKKVAPGGIKIAK